MSEPNSLNAEQVQTLLGISPATYYRWLREGKLRGTKVGRRWRFTRDAVEALLSGATARGEERRADLERARRECGQRLHELEGGGAVTAILEASPDEGERLARLLVRHALARGATDLHLTPGAAGLDVRERIDGVLRRAQPALAGEAGDEVVRAVKRLAGLTAPDACEGQFFEPLADRQVDVRCASYPSALGESVTLRLLDPARVILSLERLGFSEGVRRDLRSAVRRGKGVLVVNGPAGSGKTTTAYSLLAELNRPDLKVMTAEDPVELLIDGLVQAPVQDGLGFVAIMRRMLLADLDVGYVSELRDPESMRLLYQIAAAGHLMLSCLHAPDAPRALARLLAVGEVAPALVADETLGVLDQRLVPKSCLACRSQERLRPEDADRLELPAARRALQVSANAGCEACEGTGRRGRVAVGALLSLEAPLREAIRGGARAPEELAAAADFGGLREALLERVTAGDVSPAAAATALGL